MFTLRLCPEEEKPILEIQNLNSTFDTKEESIVQDQVAKKNIKMCQKLLPDRQKMRSFEAKAKIAPREVHRDSSAVRDTRITT
jgi:hypothetical protein